ncbi:MAG: tetratricopeptide repeat protein [Planctomycetes bacterium]|nr:tetratricopeptide repeat protein [Planctomycetota bacterium]
MTGHDDLPCLACGAGADPRREAVVLCAGCLGRAHPACWPGACPACGAGDVLGPLAAPRPAPPTGGPARLRPRWRRLALVLCVGFGAAAALARPERARPGVVPSAPVRRAPLVIAASAWSSARPGARPEAPVEAPGGEVAAMWRAVDAARAPRAAGDPAGAHAGYDRALRLWTDEPAPWAERAALRNALGDHAGALADAARVVARAPGRVDGWAEQGLALLGRGRPGEAVAAWSRLLALAPHDAWAWSNRGHARALSGDPAGALADCTRALELSPALACALSNRAAARLRLGDVEGAAADVARALALEPGRLTSSSARSP